MQAPYLSHVIDSANDLIGHVLESVLSLLQHSLDLKYILLLSKLVTISLKEEEEEEEESGLLISYTRRMKTSLKFSYFRFLFSTF